MIWLSNLLTLRVPGEEYFRNLSCALNWIVFQSFTTSNNSTKMILSFEFVFQLFCWSVCYFVRYIAFIQNLVVNAGFVFFLLIDKVTKYLKRRSFTKKTESHDITEILLKVALNTTTLTLKKRKALLFM